MPAPKSSIFCDVTMDVLLWLLTMYVIQFKISISQYHCIAYNLIEFLIKTVLLAMSLANTFKHGIFYDGQKL